MAAMVADFLVEIAAPHIYAAVAANGITYGRGLLLEDGSLLVPYHVIDEGNPCDWVSLAADPFGHHRFRWDPKQVGDRVLRRLSDDAALLRVPGLFGHKRGLSLGFLPKAALRTERGRYALLGFQDSSQPVGAGDVRFRSWPIEFDDLQIVQGGKRLVFKIAPEAASSAVYAGQSGAIVMDCVARLPIGFHVGTTPGARDGRVLDILLFSELRHELTEATWAPCISLHAANEHEIVRDILPDLTTWVGPDPIWQRRSPTTRRWLVIEGPAGSGKTVLATQFLNSLADRAHVLRVDPTTVSAIEDLGFGAAVCLDPLGRDVRSSPGSGSAGLQALLAHLRDHAGVAVFCTRSRSMSASIRKFGEAAGIEPKRVCLDVLSLAEKRRLISRALQECDEPELVDQVLRFAGRLPGSPALMRALADLGPEITRKIVELAERPETDLPTAIMNSWAARAVAGEPEATRLLAALAAVQVLRVDVSCLTAAYPWLDELGSTRTNELLLELEARGFLERTGTLNEVRIIGLPHRLLAGQDRLIAAFGVAEPEALRSNYRRLIYKRASGSTAALVETALLTFDHILLKGSFEDLQTSAMERSNSGGIYASAAETADSLFRDNAGRIAITSSLAELVEEAFADGTGRTCAERIQLCRLFRRMLHASATGQHDRARPSTETYERLRILFENWWLPNRQADSTAEFDAYVGAEAMITDAAFRFALEADAMSRTGTARANDGRALGIFLDTFRGVSGRYPTLVHPSTHLLLPALVRALHELKAGTVATGWAQQHGAPEWVRQLDMRWIETAVLIAEDARPDRRRRQVSAAMDRVRGGLGTPDIVIDLAHRHWSGAARSEDTDGIEGAVGIDRLVAYLALMRHGLAPSSRETLFMFNINTAYWLSEIFDHALFKAVIPLLGQAAHDAGARDGHHVTVGLRTVRDCADNAWEGQHLH